MVQPTGAKETPQEPAASSSDATTPSAPQPKKTLVKAQTKSVKPQGYAFLFKYVLVGNSGVGKTALLHRFSKGSFLEEHNYTIGVDFDIKTMDLPNGDEVKLQMWDTAGQERFRTITNSYYRGAHGIIIIYDVNDEESYENLSYWINEVQRYCNDDSLIAIIGTKVDMKKEGQEVYGRQKVIEHLKDEGIMSGEGSKDGGVYAVYEASAKTGEGVEEAFRDLTDQLVARRLDERNPLRGGKVGKVSTFGHDTIHLTHGGKKPKSRCC